MATNTGQMGYLPRGGAIFCTIPDILYLPELVSGGLVVSLVGSTYVYPANPQAYVISVAIFCFIMTFLWLLIFACGSHQNRNAWASADVAYHGFASLLYLSASVLLAFITILFSVDSGKDTIIYKLDVAAVVFSFSPLYCMSSTPFSQPSDGNPSETSALNLLYSSDITYNC